MSVSKKQQQKKTSQCSYYHQDHFRFYFPHLLQLFLQPLVFVYFLVLFLCGVVNGWDYHHYYNCGVIDIAIRHSWSSNYVQLDDQQLLVFQEPDVSPELCSVAVNDLHQTSNPYVAVVLQTIPVTQLFLSVYIVQACILHPAIIC